MHIVKKMDNGSYMGGYIRGYRNGKAYIKWNSFYEGEHAKIIDLVLGKRNRETNNFMGSGKSGNTERRNAPCHDA